LDGAKRKFRRNFHFLRSKKVIKNFEKIFNFINKIKKGEAFSILLREHVEQKIDKIL